MNSTDMTQNVYNCACLALIRIVYVWDTSAESTWKMTPALSRLAVRSVSSVTTTTMVEIRMAQAIDGATGSRKLQSMNGFGWAKSELKNVWNDTNSLNISGGMYEPSIQW